MVAVHVWHPEGRQVRCMLVHCLDVNLTVPVLVPVGLLLCGVDLNVRGEAAEGFPGHQGFGAEADHGGLVEQLPCYAEE